MRPTSGPTGSLVARPEGGPERGEDGEGERALGRCLHPAEVEDDHAVLIDERREVQVRVALGRDVIEERREPAVRGDRLDPGDRPADGAVEHVAVAIDEAGEVVGEGVV